LKLNARKAIAKLRRNEKKLVDIQCRLETFEKQKNSRKKLKRELTCPISMTIFREPVATECGSIYEKAHIKSWLRTRQCEGNILTDPCMGIIITRKLTPLPALKSLIERVKENFLDLD